MSKFLTKPIIAAILALLFAIGGIFGYSVAPETQVLITEEVIEKVVPAETIISPDK